MGSTHITREEESWNELTETLRRIELFMRNADKSRRLMHLSQRKVLQKARGILKEMSDKERKLMGKIQDKMDKQHKTLIECLQVMQTADETLCNVLLAIRQNEFLQAYYPAQNGMPAQRVVGKYVSSNPTGIYNASTD